MNNSNLCFYIFTGKSIHYQYQYFVRFWVKPPDQIALHGYEDTGCSSAIIFTFSEQSHHMCLQGTNHMQIWKVNMWQTSQCSIHSPSPLPLHLSTLVIQNAMVLPRALLLEHCLLLELLFSQPLKTQKYNTSFYMKKKKYKN